MYQEQTIKYNVRHHPTRDCPNLPHVLKQPINWCQPQGLTQDPVMTKRKRADIEKDDLADGLNNS